MELYIGDDGIARQKEEAYATVEFPTKKDFEQFCEMVEFYNEMHPENKIEKVTK